MRTLLIDADLRRPQFMHIFAIGEEHPSLLEWLKTSGPGLRCEELVCKGVIDNLDVIFSRPLAEINPAELLGRGQLAELLTWARQNYDRIIIDSPPIGPVGDAHILSNLSDGVILVSRIGATRRRLLKYGLNRLAQTDAQVLGCIVNDVPKTLAGMFGGAEGYEYSYGYTYRSHKGD
jgi:receptor protein-tyrosine kinase/non-specific protein-tyrosine kinase